MCDDANHSMNILFIIKKLFHLKGIRLIILYIDILIRFSALKYVATQPLLFNSGCQMWLLVACDKKHLFGLMSFHAHWNRKITHMTYREPSCVRYVAHNYRQPLPATIKQQRLHSLAFQCSDFNFFLKKKKKSYHFNKFFFFCSVPFSFMLLFCLSVIQLHLFSLCWFATV